MPVILAILVAGAYIASEVSKEHRQMHGAPTQREREWREAMDATNRHFEAQMREIWGDDWRKKSNYWRQ